MNLEPAWVAAIIAAIVLLLQIYRFTSSFAEKTTVVKTAEELQNVVAHTAKELRDTVDATAKDLRELVERTAIQRQSEVEGVFGRIETTLSEILSEAKTTNGRVRVLEDWTLSHTVEDKTNHEHLLTCLDKLALSRQKRSAAKRKK
jgi:hypothetical protein